MAIEKIGFEHHIFICTNQPDNPNKCGGKGSESIRKDLKEKCAQLYGKKVRVNSSGCLGYCEHGIAAVIYPESKWLLDLNDPKDAADKILKEL